MPSTDSALRLDPLSKPVVLCDSAAWSSAMHRGIPWAARNNNATSSSRPYFFSSAPPSSGEGVYALLQAKSGAGNDATHKAQMACVWIPYHTSWPGDHISADGIDVFKLALLKMNLDSFMEL